METHGKRVDWIAVDTIQNFAKNWLYFYVVANVWVRYGAPGEKIQTPTPFFTKHTVLYSKSMHRTQNQPIQSASVINCKY